ncbi:MAG TPA: hypothetical protein VIV06_06060 [Candidatus Limnocylindrales bacterium]
MKIVLERGVSILIALNIVALGLVLGVVAYDRLNSAPPAFGARQTVPAASPDVMQMGLAHIPTSNSCVLCHEGGGKTGIKPVPAILHPIEGWRRCVTCHTDESLGRVAPGHGGIAEEECTNCHKTGTTGPAITQPHAKLHDQHCLECHGEIAHLPSSMASSREEDCVLCHKPAVLPPPSYPHAPDARLTCRTCHQSVEVGSLPIDHALRGDASCLLCHDIRQAAGPTPPVPLSR